MRKLVVVAILIFCFSTFGVAQEVPQFEIFGGWSYIRPDGGGDDMSPTNGWNASVNIVINEWFGVAMEGGGHYTAFMDPDNNDGELSRDSNARSHNIAVGPRFTLRQNERYQPFGHAMFGVRHSSWDDFVEIDEDNEDGLSDLGLWNSNIYDNMILIFGGGLDVAVNENISIRAFQADYVIERTFGDLIPEMRLSAGVVIKYGEK